MAPGLRSMFGDRGTKGAPCAEQTNNGHGSTFVDRYFPWNTCVKPVAVGAQAPTYEFASCQADKSSVEVGTVWGTEGNRFLVPHGSRMVVPCGRKLTPLAE